MHDAFFFVKVFLDPPIILRVKIIAMVYSTSVTQTVVTQIFKTLFGAVQTHKSDINSESPVIRYF